jgi:hypothetical protein
MWRISNANPAATRDHRHRNRGGIAERRADRS